MTTLDTLEKLLMTTPQAGTAAPAAKPHPKVYKISQNPEKVKTKLNVHGKSGVGKTWFVADIAMHFKTFMMSSEFSQVTIQKHNNFARIDPNLDLWDVDSWDSVRGAFDYLMENQDKYQWAIVDSLTDVNKRVIEDILQSSKEETMSMREWGKVTGRMEKFIRYIRDIRINVAFTTLSKGEKNEMTGEVCQYPSLTGGLKEEFPAYLDINGYMYTAESKTEAGKYERIIQFVSTPKAVAKDRHNSLTYEPADMTAILKKLKLIA